MNTYVPYHMHTDYSLLDSCTKPQDYIDLAVRDGAKAISFSEHGKPLNWTEKWAACKKAGIRYLHSVEIYLTESLRELKRDNYHTVLIARNMDGVRELNNLVSLSCDKEHFYYVNRLTFDEFLKMSNNIISTSACLASPLNKLPTDHPQYMEIAKKYDFLEVQYHNCEEQISFNRRLLELSKEIGTPLIAGTDTHSANKYKAECRRVLLEAKHKSYGDEDLFDLTYKTYDELVKAFETQAAIPENEYMQAIENTNLLYDLTEDIELDTSIKYPILYGTREKDTEIFSQTVEKKFKEKLDSGVIPKEQEQDFRHAIDEEMRVFEKLNMSGFMLSMSELICWCKEQNMAIGFGRGSVCGSRVAYITDIIDVNPEKWNTVFSRFTNENRVEIGDIDTDCTETDRPLIFKYIVERFGTDKTARVASFGTMQEKGAIDDIGRCLAQRRAKKNPDTYKENPWSLANIAKIKKEYEINPEETKNRYQELFYYFDGLVDTKISQSVHPAGMVISPITLNDNYGVFDKDGDICLMLDMDNIHDYTGLAKYDFLILKTVQVIRDCCDYIGVAFPKSHEINWEDKKVWKSMTESPVGEFQFEGNYAHDCLKKFAPTSIEELALVTASVRPSGASYRDELLARKRHKNPSETIDELLKNNLGFCVFQEDSLKFLQQICGLSGSTADNVRRAIARKQRDRLDAAMPEIIKGYCDNSDKPREIAEQEVKEFVQILEDSASYQFGYNHSVSYCMLTYLCAYYRLYYPIEFLTSFLNNAANDDDIKNGTVYANKIGIKVTSPKWGISKADYNFNREQKVISKGLASVKYMSAAVADEIYALSQTKTFDSFVDILYEINNTTLNSRQLDILIKIDFFSDFGNQRELLKLTEIFYDLFKKGQAKQISKAKIEGSPLDDIVQKYAVGTTKSGAVSKNYILLDVRSILYEVELTIKSLHLDDVDDVIKAKNFTEAMGYMGYMTGKDGDRPKLYIMEVYPLKRKSDGRCFAHSILTKSIGSGVESKFTVFNNLYNAIPIEKGDIIRCKSWEREGKFFKMLSYSKIS